MRCSSCGAEVIAEAVYCHRCGQRIEEPGGESPTLPNGAEASESLPRGPAETLRAGAATQSSAEPERELWRGGYSPKAMLSGWLISGLVDVALLVIGFYWGFSAKGWLILLPLMTLPWLYFAALLGYRRLSVRYQLTTQRFQHETGILWRVTNCIETIDMDDITFSQGPLERLVGVGTIRIISSDRSHPELLLSGIAEVQAVAEKFDSARRTERRRRSIHLEQI